MTVSFFGETIIARWTIIDARLTNSFTENRARGGGPDRFTIQLPIRISAWVEHVSRFTVCTHADGRYGVLRTLLSVHQYQRDTHIPVNVHEIRSNS